jgi:hypothetical protein
MTATDQTHGWVYRLTVLSCGIEEYHYYESAYEARAWMGRLRDAGIATRMDRVPAAAFTAVTEDELTQAATREAAARMTT